MDMQWFLQFRDPNHPYLRQWSKECATLDKDALKRYLMTALEAVVTQKTEKSDPVEQTEEEEGSTEHSSDVKSSSGETGGDITTNITGAPPIPEGVILLTNGESEKLRSKISEGCDRVSPQREGREVMSRESVTSEVTIQPSVSSQASTDAAQTTIACTSKSAEVSSKEERPSSAASSPGNVLDSESAGPDFTTEFGLQELSVFALKGSGGKIPPKQAAQAVQKVATNESSASVRPIPLPPIPSLPLLTHKKPLQTSTQSAFKPVIVSAKQGIVTPPPTPGSCSTYHPATPTCTSSQLTSLLTSPISTHPHSLVPLVPAPTSSTPTSPPLYHTPRSPISTTSTAAGIQSMATTTSSSTEPLSSATCNSLTSYDTHPGNTETSCVTQLSRIRLTPDMSTNSIFAETAAFLAEFQPPRTSATPVLLNDFAEAFVKGDTTNWFKRMLLLSHIESVQDDIHRCLEQMERELDGNYSYN